ncbi:MAG TPA: hypothetical protein PLU87_00165 [Sedimentisphaerales bacterium]|nr:hypothetical protein [Sedimentisphaerales bacterium]HRS09709.1 hypothetical protein [Sedimentisphaerales bacterium]HRV46390.1 hypothetical protein [Sedimentisphaerales bacterium]
MTEIQRLIELALHRLWVAEVSVYNNEICFNIASLDESLKSTCRLSAKGRPVTWAPFALCASPEDANTACDILLENIRRIAKENGRRAPHTTEEKLARLMRRAAWRYTQKQKNEPALVGAGDEERWEH